MQETGGFMKFNQTTLFLILLIFSNILFSQTSPSGQIFTKAQAQEFYGDVIESYLINADTLLGILKSTEDKVMFSIEKDKIIIAGDSRTPLYPNNVTIPNDKVLRVYSKVKIFELIALGRKNDVVIQLRNVTTTLANGEVVLEKGYPCPPFCD